MPSMIVIRFACPRLLRLQQSFQPLPLLLSQISPTHINSLPVCRHALLLAIESARRWIEGAGFSMVGEEAGDGYHHFLAVAT
jgi:hypothetical protein